MPVRSIHTLCQRIHTNIPIITWFTIIIAITLCSNRIPHEIPESERRRCSEYKVIQSAMDENFNAIKYKFKWQQISALNSLADAWKRWGAHKAINFVQREEIFWLSKLANLLSLWWSLLLLRWNNHGGACNAHAEKPREERAIRNFSRFFLQKPCPIHQITVTKLHRAQELFNFNWIQSKIQLIALSV